MQQTKKCTKCGRELPLTDFPWRNKAKGQRRANCKECHSNYMKNKYQQKKNKIQELKAKIKCAKCGDSRGYVLDFHHIDPNLKQENISRLTSNTSSLENVYNEIKKCIVLCSNCHREFHYLQGKNKDFTLEKYLS